MRRGIVLAFLTLASVVGVQGAIMVVPTDYQQVSLALKDAVAGDTIQVLPQAEPYVDADWWEVLEGITIVGMGAYPSQTKYLIPNNDVERAVHLYGGCVLQNIQVGTDEALVLLTVVNYSVGVQIRGVVLEPIYHTGILCLEAEAEVSNVTFVGDGLCGMDCVPASQVSVTGCIFVSLLNGIEGPSPTESYNLFWDIDDPRGDEGYPTDSTDIVNVADPMIDPVTFVPGYNSIAVDSGDPNDYDDDGTQADRGGVYRSQILYTIDFLEDPGDTVQIGLPGVYGPPPKVFHPGDRCVLASRLVKTHNPPSMSSEPVLAYLVLDVYGEYYWAPDWTTDLAAQPRLIDDGYDVQTTVLDFIWPVVTSGAYGLCFWSTTITDSDGWVGPLAALPFGYEP